MIQQFRCALQDEPSRTLTPCQWQGLRLLGEAWLVARAQGQDVWQFAVEIVQLLDLGLSYTDIRCLLCWDYLEHAQERTTARASQRIFQPLKALVLLERTCFVLTAKGREILSESHAEMEEAVDASTAESTAALRSVPKAPHWNAQMRQLWWGKHLVKEFRQSAVNQELVLAAFEEEGWPPQLDDPLPPTKNIDPKVRLHDTIKRLNRHHLYRVIRFSSDGKGRGIR